MHQQTGAIVSYVLDALRQKEAAFAAIWITLGGINLTLLFTGASFPPGRPWTLGVLMMLVSGAALLLSGKLLILGQPSICQLSLMPSSQPANTFGKHQQRDYIFCGEEQH